MITYRIDTARRLVIVTATGALSAAAISEIQAALPMAAGFDPSFALLADFSQASFAAIEATHVRLHAAQDPFRPDTPRAVVVRDNADKGMVGMFKAYTELAHHAKPVRIQAFTDMQSATDWIESVRPAGR